MKNKKVKETKENKKMDFTFQFILNHKNLIFQEHYES
jgi:hypothetical protein